MTLSIIILAGGKGTRIKPVLKTIPKILAPIGGKPFFFRSKNKLISGFNQNIFDNSINLKTLLQEDIKNLEKKCFHIMKEFNYSTLSINSLKLNKKQGRVNKIKKYEYKKINRILIVGSKIFPKN